MNYDPDLLDRVPPEVWAAERILYGWFASQNIFHWKLGGVQSREDVMPMEIGHIDRFRIHVSPLQEMPPPDLKAKPNAPKGPHAHGSWWLRGRR